MSNIRPDPRCFTKEAPTSKAVGIYINRIRKEISMSTLPSTSTWKQIDLPILSSVELTTDVIELARAQWPDWAANSPQFQRILAYRPHPVSRLSSTSPSAEVLAALLTERVDPKDNPKSFNYNFYLIAKTTEGSLFQSPPIASTDPTHHSSLPSTWFNNLGSPV